MSVALLNTKCLSIFKSDSRTAVQRRVFHWHLDRFVYFTCPRQCPHVWRMGNLIKKKKKNNNFKIVLTLNSENAGNREEEPILKRQDKNMKSRRRGRDEKINKNDKICFRVRAISKSIWLSISIYTRPVGLTWHWLVCQLSWHTMPIKWHFFFFFWWDMRAQSYDTLLYSFFFFIFFRCHF